MTESDGGEILKKILSATLNYGIEMEKIIEDAKQKNIPVPSHETQSWDIMTRAAREFFDECNKKIAEGKLKQTDVDFVIQFFQVFTARFHLVKDEKKDVA